MIDILHTTASESERISLSDLIIKIGKDKKSHIVVSSGSRMHAVLECNPGEDYYTIVDLGSEQQTKLNGATINKAKVRAGDKIQIGIDILEIVNVSDKPLEVADTEPPKEDKKKPAPLVDITKASEAFPFKAPTVNHGTMQIEFEEFPFTCENKPLPRPNPSDSLMRVDPKQFDEVIEAIKIVEKHGIENEGCVRNALYLWAKLLNDMWVTKEVAYSTIEKLIRANNCARAIKMVEHLKKDRPFRTFGGMWRKLTEELNRR